MIGSAPSSPRLAQHSWRPRRGADLLDQLHDRTGVRGGLADAFQDRREVADRDALLQQGLQHALDGGGGDHGGDQVVDQLLLALGQVLQQLLHLGVGEQVRPCSP